MSLRPLLPALFFFFLSPPAIWSQEGSTAFWEQKIEAFGQAGQWDSLDQAYSSYLSFLRQKDDLAAWLYARWDWQAWYFDETKKALAILNEAVRKSWRQPQTPAEAEAMLWVQVNRGYHYFKTGNVLASIKAYEQALQWYRQHPPGDFEALEYLILPLGAHYTRLGDNEKARTLYQLAVDNPPPGANKATLAGIYNNLGLTWWNEGDFLKALEAYRRGWQLGGLPPEKSGLLHLSMAQAFFDQAQFDSAAWHLELALALLQKAPASAGVLDYRSGAWLLKGKLLAQAAKFTEGEQAINEALDLEIEALGTNRHRAVGKIHVARGQLLLSSHKPDKALRAFNMALACLLPDFDEQNPAALPGNTELYEENTLLEALEGKADAAVMLYETNKDSTWLHLALRCHHLAGKVDLRLRLLFQYQSSKLSQQEKSRSRLEKAMGTAYQLYKLSKNDKFVWEGWHFAEQAKAMVLLEGILQQRYRTGPAQTEELAKRKQLAWYEKQLLLNPQAPQRSTWLAERQQLLDDLSAMEKSLPAWQNVLRQFEQFSPEKIERIVNSHQDHKVIEYFTGTHAISVFSHHLHPRWLMISEKKPVEEKVKMLLQWLPSRSALETHRKRFCQYGHELYQQLLLPFSDHLEAQTPLLIIPDGLLSFLPFEALLTGQAALSWQETPFLIRSHPVGYAYSLLVLDTQEKLPGKAPKNLLLVAPGFENGERHLAPLLNSDEEVPGRFLCKSKRLHASAASFEQFSSLAGQFRILHLSTHAGVDSSGSLPRIEFYERSAWLPDIYALPLQADMVVLSACQTGLGELVEGEGVMSLSRAFTWAGAKGLVASQWTINESATAFILKEMYASLRNGVPKPMALHQAKLHWLNSKEVAPIQKSPYYWAALVYAGDEAPVELKNCLHWWALASLLALLLTGVLLKIRKQISKNRQP